MYEARQYKKVRKNGISRTVSSSHKGKITHCFLTRRNEVYVPDMIIQRTDLKKGDLYYGFHENRDISMDFKGAYNDTGDNGFHTIDLLNQESGITSIVEEKGLFKVIEAIDKYDTDNPKDLFNNKITKGCQIDNWLSFCKENINKINLSKQVEHINEKNRLYKNIGNTEMHELRIKGWYNVKLNENNLGNELKDWVHTAFFRRLSKLGLDFAHRYNLTIHFNVNESHHSNKNPLYGIYGQHKNEKGEYEKKYWGITYSEMHHYYKLYNDRKGPRVDFERVFMETSNGNFVPISWVKKEYAIITDFSNYIKRLKGLEHSRNEITYNGRKFIVKNTRILRQGNPLFPSMDQSSVSADISSVNHKV